MKKFLALASVVLLLFVVVMVEKDRSNPTNDINFETEDIYFGNEAKGDFNGDGQEDTAYLFSQHDGGGEIFSFITVKLANGEDLNAILLGDRIAPQTTEFINGMIIVNYADRKPGQPMTTKPSVGVSRYFKVVDNQLVEVK